VEEHISMRSTRRRVIGGAAGGALGLLAAACAGATRSAPAGPISAPSPAATPEPRELVVLAAASLTDAFTEMGEDFPRQPGNAGIKLTYSFGASSQLRVQLEQGAPGDLFASADTVQMDNAVKANTIQGTPTTFARNRLVVIVPRANPAGITTLADLARPGIKLVTTTPDVPVGNYTRQMLEKLAADPQHGAGFDQRVRGNVVSEEANVRQVVTKVQLGEADAGVVYSSDVTPQSAAALKTIEIPDALNVVAVYPVATARSAKAPATAQRFIQYLISPAGQTILKKYNFVPIA
jgi:molybdate transport system substrate-binding protein